MEPGYYLVRRPKSCVKHFGVMTVAPGRRTEVFHLLPTGYETVTPEAFAEGKRVEFGERRPLSEGPAIRERLRSIPTLNPKWSLCGHNCEHAARWVLTGRRQSRQVAAGWAAVGAAAGMLLAVVGIIARR
jgi:hypothetical protein